MTLVALGVVAAVSAAALTAGLLSWAPAPAVPARALTGEEAERLAAVRVSTYRDVRAGVRVAVGTGAGRTDLIGWVDWSRPLAYLDVGGPGAGPDRGLVQATRSTVVHRPDPTAIVTPARPPLVPPADRWRLRSLPSGRGLAGALAVLFGLAAGRAEVAEPLRAGGGRWIGQDTLGGDRVDVLQAALWPAEPSAPAGPTTAPTGHPVAGEGIPAGGSTGTPGCVAGRAGSPTAPRSPWNWTGSTGRRCGRSTRSSRPGLPRALTDEEAARLGRLPTRLRTGSGAAVTVTAPLGGAANLRGTGWLSWSAGVAYLSVAELDTLGRRTLLRRDRAGFARADVPVGPDTSATGPPLPPPTDVGWRSAGQPADELDVLVDAALRAGGATPPTNATVRVRGDRRAGRPVDVFEVRLQSQRMRYWLDRSGFPHRLELRTAGGPWAQLDLTPGPLPAEIVPPRRG